jgi:tetratricopeptide (TPR) repeat protein
MRKVLVTFVLAVSVATLALAPTLLSAQAASPDQSQPAGAGTKVIKDPAEFNAYMTAYNMTDPAQKAAAMEAFVKQYPQSIVLSEALDAAMAAYLQVGNQAKVEEIAKHILSLNPNSVRALAIVTSIDRGPATGGNAAALKESCAYAQTGLQQLANWQKPEGVDDASFAKMRDQVTDIFNGMAGFCALQAKDNAKAREYYLKALKIDPTNFLDVYGLAVASLETNPIDKTGLWYIAKAYNLSAAANKPGIAAYGKSKYKKYHGGEDGWNELLASSATQTTIPADFDVKPAATPQELACKAVQDNDPATLSFSDWEYILQYRDAGPQCNKDAAEKVWQAIVNKQKDPKGDPAKLKIPVLVVAAAPAGDSLDVAITDENQQAKPPKADLHVVMEKPLTKPPAVGSTIDVIGTISAYTPSPFMFTMTDAELPAAAKPPVHKPTPAHRPGGAHQK